MARLSAGENVDVRCVKAGFSKAPVELDGVKHEPIWPYGRAWLTIVNAVQATVMVAIAQLVEHRVVVAGVAGSSPVSHPSQSLGTEVPRLFSSHIARQCVKGGIRIPQPRQETAAQLSPAKLAMLAEDSTGIPTADAGIKQQQTGSAIPRIADNRLQPRLIRHSFGIIDNDRPRGLAREDQTWLSPVCLLATPPTPWRHEGHYLHVDRREGHAGRKVGRLWKFQTTEVND